MKKKITSAAMSIMLAAEMLVSGLVPLTANAWDGIPEDGFSPMRKMVEYATQPDSYDALDNGFGLVSVSLQRVGISVTMNEPLTESTTLGFFTLQTELLTVRQHRLQYLCFVQPQADLLKSSELYVLPDSDLTHCWQVRKERPAETLPNENNYIIRQGTSYLNSVDDTETYLELLSELEADPRFTVNGAVYGCNQWYAPFTGNLYVRFADFSVKEELEAALTAAGGDPAQQFRYGYNTEDELYYPCTAACAKAVLETYYGDPRLDDIMAASCTDGVEGSEDLDSAYLLLPAEYDENALYEAGIRVPFTATDVMTTVREYQIREGKPLYTPIRPVHEPFHYNYLDWDEYQNTQYGLCGICGITVVCPYGLEAVRQYDPTAELLTDKISAVRSQETTYRSFSVLLPGNSAYTQEEIILCSDEPETVRALIAAPEVKLLGIADRHLREEQIYIDSASGGIVLKPAEGTEFKQGDVITGDDYALTVNGTIEGTDGTLYYTASDNSGEKTDTASKAAEFCNELEAREDISYAWLIGENWCGWERTDCTIRITPFAHDQTGDADSDGDVSLKDVMAVLKHYNLTEVLGEEGLLTADRIAAADVNADGKTDTEDAVCIMKFCHFRDTLEEPKTWAEILR